MAPPFLFAPIWNIENKRLWSFYDIISLKPTLFLDERDLVVVSGDYNNWGNQAVAGTDNNDFAAPNGGVRPYTGSFSNGYATPFFTASHLSTMVDVSASWTSILTNVSYSIFCVVSCSQQSGSSVAAYLNPTIWSDASSYVGMFWNNVVSSSGIRFYNFDTGEKSTTSIPAMTGSVYILEGYYVSGSKSEFRANNYMTQSAAVVSTVGGTAGTFRIGGLGSSILTSFNGGIASVIGFQKTLSAAEKRGVRRYLANKYNVPLLGDGEDVPLEPNQYFGQALTVWAKPSTGISGSTVFDGWKSQGSFDNCWINAGGSARPIKSTQNGLITPLFDGANDIMRSYADSGSLAVFPFASASGLGQWEILITGIANGLSGTNGDPNTEVSLFSHQTSNTHGITFTSSGSRAFTTTTNGQTVTPFTSGTVNTHQRFLVHSYYDGSKLTCRFNENTVVSAACSGNIALATDVMNLGGDSSAGADYYFNGNIFEVMIFSRSLNNTERAWARTYLGTKWGIPVVGPRSTISISGSFGVNNYMTASLNGTIFSSIKWQRGNRLGGGGAFFDIAGERSVTYKLTGSDIGYSVRCIGTNIDGVEVVSNQADYDSAIDLPNTAIFVSTAGLGLEDANTTIDFWSSSLGGVSVVLRAPTSGARAAYSTAGVGGKPLLTFDGTSQWLTGSITIGSTHGYTEYAVIGNRVSFSTLGDRWIGYGTSAGTNYYGLQDRTATNLYQNCDAGSLIASGGDPDGNNQRWWCIREEPTFSASLGYGTTATATSLGGLGAQNNRADGGTMTLGANSAGGGHANIAVQAVDFGQKLTDSQRLNLRALLTNYTGIAC